MPLLQNLAQLSLIHILVAMLPGPNTVVVSYYAAAVSRRAGLETVGGVVIGAFLWVTLSLFGVGVLLAEAGEVYRAVRLAGAAYLVYVGARMLWSAWRNEALASGARAPLARQPWRAGLLTNLSNPKSAVFWTSVFVVIVPPHAPAWFLAATVLIATMQSALWYSLVVLFLSTPVAQRGYVRFARWLDVLAGTIMAGLGLRLADDVRREMM